MSGDTVPGRADRRLRASLTFQSFQATSLSVRAELPILHTNIMLNQSVGCFSSHILKPYFHTEDPAGSERATSELMALGKMSR